MLDVHAPHEVLHTWKGFFIHIATIVIGLFIAVALEQSVEAINRHREVAALREDLRQESRQILADARKSEAAHLYEIRWLTTRIAQTQLAIRERHLIGPREKNDMPSYASPDIPIWRSAKAAGRTALLTKGRGERLCGNRVRASSYRRNGSREECRSNSGQELQSRISAARKWRSGLSNASSDDLHTYLRLLTTAYETIDAYIHWLRIINGAESAVVDGKIRLDDIYASERKFAGGDSLKNFM
jgi:Rad3-related DNA helicase